VQPPTHTHQKCSSFRNIQQASVANLTKYHGTKILRLNWPPSFHKWKKRFKGRNFIQFVWKVQRAGNTGWDLTAWHTKFAIRRWNAYPTLQQTYPLTISNFPKPCASARDFDIPCLLDVPLLHESVRFGGDPERKMHVDIWTIRHCR